MQRKLTLVAIVGICAALFAWQERAARQPRVTPAGQPALLELHEAELASVRQQFNAAAGETRVVVWLSPT